MVRVCTWNTYQATTMPYRHFRRPGLYPALSYLSHHNVDILCLQEQNSTRFGPLTYLLWRLALLLPFVFNSFAMEVLEYLAVGEGFLLPLFVADNKRQVIDYCREHTRFKYHVTVPPPRYFFDSGLIILSAHPVDLPSYHQVHLRRDAGNRPGLLAVNITLPTGAKLRVYDVHFVPTLLDVTPVFRVLNFINGRLGRDTRRLRREHFGVMIEDIKAWHAKDEEVMVVVAGDFNISRGSEEEKTFTRLVREEVGLHPCTMRPVRATACERTFGHEGQQRQPDPPPLSAQSGGWVLTFEPSLLCCVDRSDRLCVRRQPSDEAVPGVHGRGQAEAACGGLPVQGRWGVRVPQCGARVAGT